MSGNEAVIFVFVFIMAGGVVSIAAFILTHLLLNKFASQITIVSTENANSANWRKNK